MQHLYIDFAPTAYDIQGWYQRYFTPKRHKIERKFTEYKMGVYTLFLLFRVKS